MFLSSLTLTTCQAINTVELTRQIAAYLTNHGIPVTYVDHQEWQTRYRQLAGGALDIAWVCPWPAVNLLSEKNPAVELLVAPLFSPPHYANTAAYFSYMIVHQDSDLNDIHALAEARLAVNDVDSHSGSRIVRSWLAQQPRPDRFIAGVLSTGSHLGSIAAVQNGQADCAAIDSTLFDWLAIHQPRSLANIRTIARLGPSPGPPLLINKKISPNQRKVIREALQQMHRSRHGAKALKQGLVAKFGSPEQFDFATMWEMSKSIDQVGW